MIYKRFDIVKVPFPFTDSQTSKTRPALVLSDHVQFNSVIGHSVMAMITSAKHIAWPLDTDIQNLAATGLTAPSKIRLKLFTLDHRLILGCLGQLEPVDQAQVELRLKTLFGW